jgi:hypothetical protein
MVSPSVPDEVDSGVEANATGEKEVNVSHAENIARHEVLEGPILVKVDSYKDDKYAQ